MCRRLLHSMLIKSPAQRISLIDVLNDKELRQTLENPQNGTVQFDGTFTIHALCMYMYM